MTGLYKQGCFLQGFQLHNLSAFDPPIRLWTLLE